MTHELSARDRLPPNQQLVSAERWPVVGETAPRQDDTPWTVTVTGLVAAEFSYSLDELRDSALVERRVDIHCVTRWSKYDVAFRGLPLHELLNRANVSPAAAFVSFVARSARGHSTSLPLRDIFDLDPLIALEADGLPLETIHGGPVRLIVPGKYFYKSVKWLARIECLSEDRLGYWEADAGYHNGADPWREERYMAPALSKQEAAELISSLNFKHRNLRGISAQHRDLTGLVATGALLRDADFRGALLRNADFSGANLSNAHFQGANLQNARFVDADVEGADFTDADLRGTDFRVASMFGTSFGEYPVGGETTCAARIDKSTVIDVAKLDALTDDQRRLVQLLISR